MKMNARSNNPKITGNLFHNRSPPEGSLDDKKAFKSPSKSSAGRKMEAPVWVITRQSFRFFRRPLNTTHAFLPEANSDFIYSHSFVIRYFITGNFIFLIWAMLLE